MKYIVCNSENSVFNRVYDELEKFIEPGAVFSFSDKILNTQFLKRIVDEKNNGKYDYKHIIFLGQKDFAEIDIEEEVSLMNIMRKYLYKPLEIDYKNIFYPQFFKEGDLEKYQNNVDENEIDVALLCLDSDGFIIDYQYLTEENKKVHCYNVSSKEAKRIEKTYNVECKNKFISIGFNNILNARNIFLVILGKDKREYLEKIFEDNIDNDNSILTHFKNHKNITVFVDKEVGYKSEDEVNRLIKEKKRKQELEKLRKLEQEKLSKDE